MNVTGTKFRWISVHDLIFFKDRCHLCCNQPSNFCLARKSSLDWCHTCSHVDLWFFALASQDGWLVPTLIPKVVEVPLWNIKSILSWREVVSTYFTVRVDFVASVEYPNLDQNLNQNLCIDPSRPGSINDYRKHQTK